MTPKDSAGRIIPLNKLDGEIQKLLKESVKAREMAYCPYRKFKVGAALLTDNGDIYTGCNVENASYGASICAERTPIVKSVSSGDKKFKLLAVCGNVEEQILSPCGICRQFIVEFCNTSDLPVYLCDSSLKQILETTARGLLPLAFVEF